MFRRLGNISVNGYRPFSGFNLVLGAVSGMGLGLFIFRPPTAPAEGYAFLGLIGIVFFLILLFRNRRVRSIPRMITYSLVSVILGIIIAIVRFWIWQIKTYGLFGMGGSTSGESSGSKWTKGKYSTDGQDDGFSKQDDLNARMQGYANAQQYQDLTGYSGHDINPDDSYTRHK